MLYQIYCDGYLIDDVRTDDYIAENPTLRYEKNKVAGLTFALYKTHPNYDKIKIKRSLIEVRKDGKPILRGRPSEYTQEFNLKMAVDVEGVLSFLNDSIFSPFEFTGSPADLFTQVIENHNAQVQDWQQLKIGQIDTLDNNDYILRSSIEYLKSWEVIETRLLNIGGLLRVRYEDDGNYIDWLKGTQEQLNTATQSIKYGENLIDLKKTNSGTETYTAALPLGVQDEETQARLTIEDLPDDDSEDIVKVGKWIYSKTAVENYGWVAAPIANTTWDDVTLAENLLKKCKAYLTGEAMLITGTLEMNAYDLGLSDDEIQSFNFLDYILVKSAVHGVDATYLLSKLELPYKQPQNAKITVGETKATLTAEQLGNKHQQNDLIDQIETVKKDYVTNAKLEKVVEQEQKNNTAILQAAEKITMEAVEECVTDDEYQKDKAQIELTNDAFAARFNSVEKRTEEINGDLQNKYNEITTFFQFDINGFTIGKADSPYRIFIDDNEFSMFANGVRVLYFELSEKKGYEANIPELTVSSLFNLFGYSIEQDHLGNVNCAYTGG